ncbi:asparaginase [Frondihabitans australicus]|uniref:Asparaginase n=1 Tax=Frondihabitans australicus TaxID=386892 RepID=A0A495ID21_9MICO|nr:asparaginase [Frondihabitans australicus]RKR73819.1 asparaginase [Frondihabitans australicus]
MDDLHHAPSSPTTPSANAAARPRHPLDADGSVELAVVERSGLAESRHLGAAVVVNAQGDVLDALGDAEATIYPRSCLKPLQALAVLRAGVDLEGAQAVLAMASHAGTPAHQQVVRDMLARSNSGPEDLLCPPDWPYDRATARTATEKTRLFMNCSGKHAAFLLACERNGWNKKTYDALDHPLQSAIRDTIEEFAGERPDHAGVDGCGAPVYALTLRGLATGIARVTGAATADPSSAAAHLTRSVLADAWALDGTGRANTVTIEELGVVAKLGAEGVLVIGTTGGTAVALKMLDGNLRAGTLVALRLLTDLGAVDADAAQRVVDHTLERVLGGGEVVGSIRLGAAFGGR